MSTPSPPEVVYLDTSVVVAAIIPGSDHVGPCAAFCNDLVAAGSRIFFSQILRLELSQALLKLATRRAGLPSDTSAAYRLDDWGADPSVRDRWLRIGVRAFDDLFERFPRVLELPFDVGTWQTSLDVMVAHGLRSHDAIHVATARQLGVPTIATADDHFKRVAGEFELLLIQDGGSP